VYSGVSVLMTLEYTGSEKEIAINSQIYYLFDYVPHIMEELYIYKNNRRYFVETTFKPGKYTLFSTTVLPSNKRITEFIIEPSVLRRSDELQFNYFMNFYYERGIFLVEKSTIQDEIYPISKYFDITETGLGYYHKEPDIYYFNPNLGPGVYSFFTIRLNNISYGLQIINEAAIL